MTCVSEQFGYTFYYNVLILYTHIHWITLSTQLSAVIVNEGYVLIIKL